MNRPQISIKTLTEDEELLVVILSKTRDVSVHAIVRNGSTHSDIAPSLAWVITVASNITATSSALSQIEVNFVYKYKDMRGVAVIQKTLTQSNCFPWECCFFLQKLSILLKLL